MKIRKNIKEQDEHGNRNNNNIIVFDKVTKSFNGDLILNSISFTIKKGEVVCIMGRSGSGKTTIARLINGLLLPESGSIFIANLQVSKESTYAIRKKTAFVFQNSNLFFHMTAIENIMYAPLHVYKMQKEVVEEKLIHLCNKFGVHNILYKYPSQLSGGQKQRIAIIRALITSPEIIIMDEPTASLDPEMTNEVVNLINFIRQEGVTVVLVTHDINVAKNAAQKILFIANGQCTDYMTVDQFFSLDRLKSPSANGFLNGSLALNLTL